MCQRERLRRSQAQMLFKAYWKWIDGADKSRERDKMNAVCGHDWATESGAKKALLIQAGGLEWRGEALMLNLSAARALISAKACDVSEDLSKNRSAPSRRLRFR